MHQKFDKNTQRQLWVTSRPNKRRRAEIVEIDGELLTRANRFGGDYQSLEDRIKEEENQQQSGMAEEIELENEGESQVIQCDNFPIVDLKAFNTDGKDAQFIQMNQVIAKMTEDRKTTEYSIKKAICSFMLDIKSLITKSGTDADLNRVRYAMRRGEENTAPETYRPTNEKFHVSGA